MSVSLCMQAFQEIGKREKTFQNFCTKIIYTFCSQRKGKTDKRRATFLWDGTSNAVCRRAGKVVLDSGTHSSLKAVGIRPHTCTAETGTGFLLDSPHRKLPWRGIGSADSSTPLACMATKRHRHKVMPLPAPKTWIPTSQGMRPAGKKTGQGGDQQCPI